MKAGDVDLDGTWWRFTEYELWAGYIRPAPGATLERYRIFDELPRRKGRKDPAGPHLELANLDMDDEAAILSWVRRYGLLGLLPHRLVQAEFANNVAFVRGPTGWELRYKGVEWPLPAELDKYAPAALPPGRAVLADWLGRGVEVWGDHVFSDYFPDGPQDGYPLILTDAFWYRYAEPIQEFKYFIEMFRRVLIAYAGFSTEREQITERDKLVFEWAREWIQANATVRLNTSFADSPSARVISLITPSLISTLATLVWLDWGGQRSVRTCARCGNLFVTSLRSKDYCSERCRKAAEMKRYRGRKEA